jgi:hypothetical protein
LNDSQDLVANNHGNNRVTRDATFINLFHQETKLLPGNTRRPPIINLDESPMTWAHGNIKVKKNTNLFFHLSLSLPIKTTKFGGCNGEDQCCTT